MTISFDDLKKDTFAARTWFKAYSDQIYASVFPNITEEYFFIDHNRLIDEADTVTRMRFLLENKGVSLRSLVLSHGANDYFFSTPNNFIADLNDTYSHYLKVSEGNLPTLIDNGILLARPLGRCEELARLSLATMKEEELSQKVTQVHFNRPGKDLSALGRCMKCHTLKYKEGKTRAPYIPFDDSAKMKELFKSTGLAQEMKYRITTEDRFDQMPPRTPLSKEERAAVIEYIDTLKK